jgi:hypothetical protein
LVHNLIYYVRFLSARIFPNTSTQLGAGARRARAGERRRLDGRGHSRDSAQRRRASRRPASRVAGGAAPPFVVRKSKSSD